jgi:hypothetical protein
MLRYFSSHWKPGASEVSEKHTIIYAKSLHHFTVTFCAFSHYGLSILEGLLACLLLFSLGRQILFLHLLPGYLANII